MRAYASATVVFASIVISAAAPSIAQADIPAGYKGTPYHGAPTPIPGRVNLADYDLGGTNVSYNCNHTAPPTSAPDYRTDKADAALIYVTSEVGGIPNNPVPDTYSAGPLKGMFYPGSGKKDYYIGATHPGDWVNVTVDVKTAGTYMLSSTWSSGATATEGIDYKVFLNDLTRTNAALEVKLPTTGDYHSWAPDSGHMIDLNAGVQVLTFQCVVHHLNLDYLQFDLMGSDGGAGGTSGADAGGAGAPGTGGAMGTGGATGAGGAPGTGGATGTGGAAGETSASGGAGMTGGAAGTTGGQAGATGGAAGTSGGGGTSAGGSKSSSHGGGGCAVSGEATGSRFTLGLALAFVAFVRARRRGRR
jgi:hypothetical protein